MLAPPKLMDVPLTAPTIAVPNAPEFILYVTTTWFVLLSNAAAKLNELPTLKTTAVPKLIDVPLTVATIAVPLVLLPISRYTITTLLELLSNVADTWSALALSNSAALPKLIDVPLTVPTIAVP